MEHLGAILIADDEETFREATAYLLRQQGYRCDSAADGFEALDMLQAGGYDLLVADIKMPGNDDLGLVQKVQEVTGGLPVILATGHPSVETATRSVPLPVVAYLTKPVAFEELLRYVDSVMERAGTKRLARRTLESMEACADKLREMLHDLGRAAKADGRTRLAASLEETAMSLAEGYHAVQRLHVSLAGAGAKSDPCRLLGCSRLDALESAVHEGIDTIEKTKNSFKSKELGSLRRTLQQVLERSKQPGRPRLDAPCSLS